MRARVTKRLWLWLLLLLGLVALGRIVFPRYLAFEDVEQGSRRYDFTTDYTSWHEPDWNEHLSHLRGKPDTTALEIGCFEGRTTIWLAENIFNGPGAQVDCVDLFGIREREMRCRDNVSNSPVTDRIRIHKGPSQIVVREFPPDSFDFVYVDGCHETHCALSDLINALVVVKVSGIIMIDDYTMAKVRRATDIFTDIYADQIEVVFLRSERRTMKDAVGVAVLRRVKQTFSHPIDVQRTE